MRGMLHAVRILAEPPNPNSNTNPTPHPPRPKQEFENAAKLFMSDPYGCHSPLLQQKRLERNPFRCVWWDVGWGGWCLDAACYPTHAH